MLLSDPPMHAPLLFVHFSKMPDFILFFFTDNCPLPIESRVFHLNFTEVSAKNCSDTWSVWTMVRRGELWGGRCLPLHTRSEVWKWYLCWLLVKCGIAECGMRKVKCGIQKCGKICGMVGKTRNAERTVCKVDHRS